MKTLKIIVDEREYEYDCSILPEKVCNPQCRFYNDCHVPAKSKLCIMFDEDRIVMCCDCKNLKEIKH